MALKEQTKKPSVVSEETKEEPLSFSQRLWIKCLNTRLPESALATGFIKGIHKGSLEIKSYGPFFIQDILYLNRGSELWAKTAVRAEQQNKTDIAEYCNQRKKRWAEYATLYAKEWHVKPDGIVLGDAISQYLDYEQYVIDKYGVEYIFVAFYGCLKLWPYIGNQLKKSQRVDDDTNDDNKIDDGPNNGSNKDRIDSYTKLANTNLYQFWIDGNLSHKSAVRNEKWMDLLYKENKIDENVAFEIVCNCLKLEINFFKEATNQKTDVIQLYGIEHAENNGEYKPITQKINVCLVPITRSKSLPMEMKR